MGSDDELEDGVEPGKRVRSEGDVFVLGVHDRARKRRRRDKEKQISRDSKPGDEGSRDKRRVASSIARKETENSIAIKGGRPSLAEGRLMIETENEFSSIAEEESQSNSQSNSTDSKGGRLSTAEGRLRSTASERVAEGPKGSKLGEQLVGLSKGPMGEKLGESQWGGLEPPKLASGERINGSNKKQHRRENKRKRIQKQEEQPEQTYWSKHEGKFEMPEPKQGVDEWKGGMCPQGLALHHPAAGALLEYATQGCPCNTGKDWTKEQLWAAVERGPHVSALEPDAIEQMEQEIAEKQKQGQVKVVLWDDIKDNPPAQLKVSPLAMIPHKSRKYRAIDRSLD
eukprot:scaffold50778_cov74-Cyclotella_meneghiniana.AAC.1